MEGCTPVSFAFEFLERKRSANECCARRSMRNVAHPAPEAAASPEICERPSNVRSGVHITGPGGASQHALSLRAPSLAYAAMPPKRDLPRRAADAVPTQGQGEAPVDPWAGLESDKRRTAPSPWKAGARRPARRSPTRSRPSSSSAPEGQPGGRAGSSSAPSKQEPSNDTPHNEDVGQRADAGATASPHEIHSGPGEGLQGDDAARGASYQNNTIVGASVNL